MLLHEGCCLGGREDLFPKGGRFSRVQGSVGGRSCAKEGMGPHKVPEAVEVSLEHLGELILMGFVDRLLANLLVFLVCSGVSALSLRSQGFVILGPAVGLEEASASPEGDPDPYSVHV